MESGPSVEKLGKDLIAHDEQLDENTSQTTIERNSVADKEIENEKHDEKDMTKEKTDKEFKDSEAEQEQEDEIDDLEDTDLATGLDRNRLYEKGIKLYRRGRQDLALKYLLACITKLEETSGFTFLPQCLHHIADIYYERGEYEKAIQFIQAEKMYYETALIDTSLLQKKVEEQQHDKDNLANEDDTKPQIERADEYEALAKLCLEKKQPHMALEYQGKATKLRQQVYGEHHPVTTKSLDFFTVIYGEVGRFQYSESVEKLKSKHPVEKVGDTSHESGDTLSSPPSKLLSSENSTPEEESMEKLKRKHPVEKIGDTSHESGDNLLSPKTILISRENSTPEEDAMRERKRRNSKVRFEVPRPDSSVRALRQQEEEGIAHIVLGVVFFALGILLMFLLAYIYCKLSPDSKTCTAWKLELHYYFMRIKYYYYYYTSSSKHTYG